MGVIRRHFLDAAVDPAISLSTYSPRPMEVIPMEDAAVDAHAERSMRVHWFGCAAVTVE